MTAKGVCRACGLPQELTSAGTLVDHREVLKVGWTGASHRKCPGSGKKPKT